MHKKIHQNNKKMGTQCVISLAKIIGKNWSREINNGTYKFPIYVFRLYIMYHACIQV